MAKQNGILKEIVERVMRKFKHGELEFGNSTKVRNPKQAVAIMLSEAGASNRQSPQTNRRRLVETKRKERSGRAVTTRQADGPTRAELYEDAAQKGVAGRSLISYLQEANNESWEPTAVAAAFRPIASQIAVQDNFGILSCLVSRSP